MFLGQVDPVGARLHVCIGVVNAHRLSLREIFLGGFHALFPGFEDILIDAFVAEVFEVGLEKA